MGCSILLTGSLLRQEFVVAQSTTASLGSDTLQSVLDGCPRTADNINRIAARSLLNMSLC